MGSRFSVFFPYLNGVAMPPDDLASDDEQPQIREVLLDRAEREYVALAQEYVALATAKRLSDAQADRMGSLLEIACQDETFSLIINEVDESLLQADECSCPSRKSHTDDQISIVKEFVLSDGANDGTNDSHWRSPLWEAEDCNHTQRLLNFLHRSALQQLPGMNDARAVQICSYKDNCRWQSPYAQGQEDYQRAVKPKMNYPDTLRATKFNIHQDRLKELRLQIQQPQQMAASKLLGDREKPLVRLAAIASLLTASSIASFALLRHASIPQSARSTHLPPLSVPTDRPTASSNQIAYIRHVHDTAPDVEELSDRALHEKIDKWTNREQLAINNQLIAKNERAYAKKKQNVLAVEHWQQELLAAAAKHETAVDHVDHFQTELARREWDSYLQNAVWGYNDISALPVE